ncbi:MAG TPA: hypothetical protein VFD13_07300 [Candidatus Kapabacteria bacterium]|nr:hypothetical protein [Candidatus Kapabacteria bacterium]
MKTSILLAIVISFSILAPSAQAQHAKKHSMRRTTSTTDSTAIQAAESSSLSPAGAEVSGVTGSAPGDPYNLAHPYFQGEPRWSDVNQLYLHGDFPWALVSKHPEDFQFNTSSSKWETTSTANLGKSK